MTNGKQPGPSAAELLAERDAVREDLWQAENVLREVRAALGCADGDNVVDAAREIVDENEEHEATIREIRDAQRKLDSVSAERDHWSRRARTQYALARWKALDSAAAEKLLTNTRILERAIVGYQNMLNAMGGNACTFACPTCGLVWTAAKEMPTDRGGWRLCDRCLATEPNPWAAADTEVPATSYATAGGEGVER